MKYYRVHHMQRSGGHVFCQWLASMVQQPVLWVNDVMQAAVDNRIGPIEQMETVILSFEDLDVSYAQRISKVYMDLFWKWPQGDITDIVVVRDPYNLFASRKHFDVECMAGNCTPEAVRLWESHAAYCGKYRTDFWVFCYDNLISDKSCREDVASLLRLPEAPWPESEPALGTPSQFNSDPLTRYKSVHPSFFDEIFTDRTRELARLWK